MCVWGMQVTYLRSQSVQAKDHNNADLAILMIIIILISPLLHPALHYASYNFQYCMEVQLIVSHESRKYNDSLRNSLSHAWLIL